MPDAIITNVLVLDIIAVAAAVILYFVSKKFKVRENRKLAEVEECLPQANCGACGKAGCHDFASACAGSNEEEFGKLYCPVGGKAVMDKVAAILGFKTFDAPENTVAVLRCNGTCQNAPAKKIYDGVDSCRIAVTISSSPNGCPEGCVHLGDCVKVCPFGALSMDEETKMPVVDADKCTSCGKCVKTCPRGLFEIRPRGKNGKRVYVACRNTQKGAIARKNCKVACIGCQKCTAVNALVKVKDNLSYIPTNVSAEKYGAELAKACPTGAIIYIGDKPKEENMHEEN